MSVTLLKASIQVKVYRLQPGTVPSRTMNEHRPNGLTYADSGVDIDRGERLVERIKPIAARTRRAEVLTGLGGFGGLVEVPLERYSHPVLVSGTDGVGTKLRLAIDSGRHDTIGIDLVAMCANDILVHGAEPLYFLDYFATGKLDEAVAEQVIRGIGHGCELAGAALIGGETAEMPGMYAGDDYDLAGFCVGIVEKSAIIDGSSIVPGDALIALASSGPHANGYSLIRRVLQLTNTAPTAELAGHSILDQLLAPTRIYVRSVRALLEVGAVHGIAHITGGGLTENLPRILPPETTARLDDTSWELPAIFAWLQSQGGISTAEMRRTFNCGIGMVVCVPEDDVEMALAVLNKDETAWRCGTVVDRVGSSPLVWD